jgi:hypothetical protein
MLLVQEYLLTHTFQQLIDEHGVYPSFSKSGHKFSLNYDQIEARESDLLAQECRGLVLTTGKVVIGITGLDGKINRNHICPGPTSILAFPMKRFFNHGQGSAASINWSDPKLSVLEKLDGTLCIVYFDSIIDKWCVATRSVPEADILLDNGLYTFRTLFEKALTETTGKTFSDFTFNLKKDNTYCFELTTPLNRIVVKYDDYSVTLLSIRNNSSTEEISVNHTALASSFFGVKIVESHSINNVNEILDWVSSLNPLEHEGVVVLDSNFNRIKVKNANYVAFSKARDLLGSSERNCLELILSEKDDDVIPALPQEIVDNLLKIKAGIVKSFKDYDAKYIQILNEANSILSGDKKTFAITLQSHKDLWQAPFFNIYGGRSNNMKEFVLNSKKEGTWPNSFLDKILEISKNYQDEIR